MIQGSGKIQNYSDCQLQFYHKHVIETFTKGRLLNQRVEQSKLHLPIGAEDQISRMCLAQGVNRSATAPEFLVGV